MPGEKSFKFLQDKWRILTNIPAQLCLSPHWGCWPCCLGNRTCGSHVCWSTLCHRCRKLQVCYSPWSYHAQNDKMGMWSIIKIVIIYNYPEIEMAWPTRLLYYGTTSTKSLIGYSQTDQLDKLKATRLIKN